MRLVFVHGWGFDPRVWDHVAAALCGIPEVRIDLGFFGEAKTLDFTPDDVLIGHSLGFLWGMHAYRGWQSWIAVNSFSRFAGACVPLAALRALRQNLKRDAEQALRDFYATIGYPAEPHLPNVERLAQGLDMLQRLDIAPILSENAAPGLVLASRNDPLVPQEASEALGRPIRWSADGGHLLPLTQAEWCADAIRQHVS